MKPLVNNIMDFTFRTYQRLIMTLLSQSYKFQSFKEFLTNPAPKSIVLRHDIDKLPGNALKIAQLEYELGVHGSYYFRVVPRVWDENVMEQIVLLGHELGYHYEDLSIAGGNYRKAIQHFENQLRRLRRIYPVATICMHGSPLSRYDNRVQWEHYDYRDFGIIGEPYFDVDFKEVFYITDTGRKWNNFGTIIRDRVKSGFNIPINSSFHLMELAWQNVLPDQIMINVHPQRWHGLVMPWTTELILQNTKNMIKILLLMMRKRSLD